MATRRQKRRSKVPGIHPINPGQQLNDIASINFQNFTVMIKKLTSYLDYSMFAEAALAIFAVVFIAIVIRTLLIKSEIADEQSRIVLGDKKENVHE